MKLLFDENLSRRLVRLLADLYPESEHVVTSGLGTADDLEIWRYAASRGLTITTKDWDFLELSTLRGHPPKVLWLRLGNCSVSELADVLRRHHIEILRFEEDPAAALLIID